MPLMVVVVRMRETCVTIDHQVVDIAVRHFTSFRQQASVDLRSKQSERGRASKDADIEGEKLFRCVDSPEVSSESPCVVGR